MKFNIKNNLFAVGLAASMLFGMATNAAVFAYTANLENQQHQGTGVAVGQYDNSHQTLTFSYIGVYYGVPNAPVNVNIHTLDNTFSVTRSVNPYDLYTGFFVVNDQPVDKHFKCYLDNNLVELDVLDNHNNTVLSGVFKPVDTSHLDPVPCPEPVASASIFAGAFGIFALFRKNLLTRFKR
jgi:hypothetical protein